MPDRGKKGDTLAISNVNYAYFLLHMIPWRKGIGEFFLPSSKNKHRDCEITLKNFRA